MDRNRKRRKLVIGTLMASAASPLIQKQAWVSPIIQSVLLPAHAEMSEPSENGPLDPEQFSCIASFISINNNIVLNFDGTTCSAEVAGAVTADTILRVSAFIVPMTLTSGTVNYAPDPMSNWSTTEPDPPPVDNDSQTFTNIPFVRDGLNYTLTFSVLAVMGDSFIIVQGAEVNRL